MSEAVPSDGGFLVQKDFSADLIQRVYQTGEIASRVRRIPIGPNANGVKLNGIDEDSRVDGSRWGGVRAYWVNEADAFTGTKPKFRQIELQLQKLIALCYSTDELLQDAAALEAVISQAFGQELTFKVEDAIINGTGSGQPLGLMNSGAVIQVAKDAADTVATVSTNDVLNMWQRLYGPSRQNAVWFMNQDVEAKLYPLTLGTGTAVQLLYMPPGQNGNQYGMLLGRPVIPTEHNATLGTPGDLVLADLSQYMLIDKGAPRQDYSIHVRFLNDEGVFRFVYRVDGQPAWKKALTPKNGTNTQSPFITLATRP
jgi:HK97 family phage major capsid protein